METKNRKYRNGAFLRKIKFLVIILVFFSYTQHLFAQKKSESPIVHDPVMIKQNDTYYLFCTGWGISMLSSKDLINWKREKPVFKEPPGWTKESVKDFKGHIWAPDIFYHKGIYYLYYSVSSFAKNTSCIGLATNTTLDPNDKNYKWVDQGKIVQSVPGRDMWNAIDPNIIMDELGTPWMTFGSFWNGLKLVKLSKDLKSIDKENEEWYTVASRKRSFEIEDKNPGDAALEAPFIFKKGDYYYLFVSFDFCCRGTNSDYKIVVGRAKKVTGPYLDKDGEKMEFGGGSVVLQGNTDWPGVGHNSAYSFNGKDYLVFHGYDAKDGGKPKLHITEIIWDKDGWPTASIE